MSRFDLSGRVAIVTGGNGGLGLGIARGLAEARATVVVAARDPRKSQAAVEALLATGASAAAIPVDVTVESSCRALVEATLARFARLDVVVNNAGMNIRKRPHEYTLSEWHQVVDTNLTGAFSLSQAAHGALSRGGGGKIINVGSLMAVFASSITPAYAASKGGLVQLTKSLAVAWAKDRIQVNTLLPGWIDTELTRGARAEIAGLEERVVARTPAGRWGTPEDVAGAAVFLASAASDFVTGTSVVVDGGYSAQA